MKRYIWIWCVAVLCVGVSQVQAELGSDTSFAPPNRPAVSPVSGEPLNVKYAAMREDMESLKKDVRELNLRIEELEREKAALQASVALNSASNYVTRDELKLSEGRLNEALVAESKRVEGVILEEIRAAKKLAAAQVAPVSTPTVEARPAPKPVVVNAPTAAEKEAYMREGVRHTIASGETLSQIARKYKSTVRALMVANDITDPTKLYVGRELFVPLVTK